MRNIARFFLMLFLCLSFVGNSFAQTNDGSNHPKHKLKITHKPNPIVAAATAPQPDIICTLQMAEEYPEFCFSKAKNRVQLQAQLKRKLAKKKNRFKAAKKTKAVKYDESEFELPEEAKPVMLEDPYEKYNREVYKFNEVVDTKVIEPVAKAYEKAVPKPARKSVRNFLSNASLPMSFFNSILQGDVENTLSTFSHLLINTTVGIGGLFDVAGSKGIRYRKETFSQTLGKYGVGPGPYIVIPFLGPSSTRDLLGFGFDKAVDPTSFNALGVGGNSGSVIGSKNSIAMFLVSGVDRRESVLSLIDQIRAESFDPYTTIKSIYSQDQAAKDKE